MADPQPPNVVEGATAGDVDEENPIAAKSAEERKAAAALSSLDAPRDDEANAKNVDQDAVRKAMDRLAGSGAANGAATKKGEDKQAPKKIVKVDQADVTLLVDELELTKVKATELLKAHDGEVISALKAFVGPPDTLTA